MPADYHDFFFAISIDPRTDTKRNLFNPADGFAGRVTRSALEAINGPIRRDQTLADVYEDNRTGVNNLASTKLKAFWPGEGVTVIDYDDVP